MRLDWSRNPEIEPWTFNSVLWSPQLWVRQIFPLTIHELLHKNNKLRVSKKTRKINILNKGWNCKASLKKQIVKYVYQKINENIKTSIILKFWCWVWPWSCLNRRIITYLSNPLLFLGVWRSCDVVGGIIYINSLLLDGNYEREGFAGFFLGRFDRGDISERNDLGGGVVSLPFFECHQSLGSQHKPSTTLTIKYLRHCLRNRASLSRNPSLSIDCTSFWTLMSAICLSIYYSKSIINSQCKMGKLLTIIK